VIVSASSSGGESETEGHAAGWESARERGTKAGKFMKR